jgi:hypothetical protein
MNDELSGLVRSLKGVGTRLFLVLTQRGVGSSTASVHFVADSLPGRRMTYSAVMPGQLFTSIVEVAGTKERKQLSLVFLIEFATSGSPSLVFLRFFFFLAIFVVNDP